MKCSSWRGWGSMLALLAIAAPSPRAAGAALKVSRLVADGMVVQRGVSVPIVGSATPHAKVVATIAGRRSTARADDAGRFNVKIAALEAGGPYDMTIVSGGERLSFRDVMVGDVWVCSGQSNMEWAVADSLDATKEIAAAIDPKIRHFKVPRSWATAPEENLAGGAWERADPEHAGGFTAVGYFFARELRKHVDVPVGLINTSWGGSRIEPWMSAAALGLDGAGVRSLLARERDYGQEVLNALRTRVGVLPDRDGGLVGGRAVWADPDLDDSAWDRISVPARWEEVGFEGMDGVAWYRTSFELTAEEVSAGVTLGLGTIDDSDIAWVNGHEVGRTELAWNRPRVYTASVGSLRPGRNVVAVRVEDAGGGGGIWGDPALLYVETRGQKRALAGDWRFKIGVVSVNLDFHKNEVPTVLYNAMLHPLLSYPIKGVLWYQGESNAGPGDAFAYRDLFRAMIADWRAGWGRGDVPFLFVQLANFHAATPEPDDSSWALLRESQSSALALPRTAQAVAIDIGDANDIHPRNKQEVGRRLALAACSVAYGEKLEFSGPMYRGHEVRDGRIVIDFAHTGGGLVAKGDATGRLVGFAVSGADRRFVWADAVIEGGRIVVWSERVPAPVAVRYAWADNPAGANLYNVDGLPASPFRTDAW